MNFDGLIRPARSQQSQTGSQPFQQTQQPNQPFQQQQADRSITQQQASYDSFGGLEFQQRPSTAFSDQSFSQSNITPNQGQTYEQQLTGQQLGQTSQASGYGGMLQQRSLQSPYTPQYPSQTYVNPQQQFKPFTPQQAQRQALRQAQQQTQQQQRSGWNLSEYLQSVFNSVDMQRNGTISPNELVVALSKTHQTILFDQKTVDFLLKKFDSNHDNRITCNEFFQLCSFINDEYNKFLTYDADSSGTIGVAELANLLDNFGLHINQQTINYIVSHIEQMLQKRIPFDVYCRVNARFDYLLKNYRMMQSQYGNQPFEQYLINNFFTEFW